MVEQLARRDDVKLILPNSEIRLDPPEFVESGTIPLGVEWGVSRVNAPAVWDKGFTGEGVVVGVIDSGVEWQHQALQSKWRGHNPLNPGNLNVDYNWYDATSVKSALPADSDGHGTHVTGTILGSAGSNQIGVAPGAQWIAARIFGGNDGGTAAVILDAAQFMLAPTDMNGQYPRPDLAPDIINNSWGSSLPGDASGKSLRPWKAWTCATTTCF